MQLNVAFVVPRTEAEGPGRRYALWVQGCPLRCPGCCNPEMLADVPRSMRGPDDLLAEIVAAEVEGVTLLGGEPFAQAAPLARLCEGVRRAGLSVMIFSGYTLDALRHRATFEASTAALLAQTDLLVDGPYVSALHCTDRRWIGSSNQVLHFLTDRYRPEDARFSAPNHLEIRLAQGQVMVNGWPRGDLQRPDPTD